MEELVDSHNRAVKYLRLSITARCNLRCEYCKPEDVANISESGFLTLDESFYLVSLFAKLGIRKLRVTGGEPLMRPGAIDFIKRVNDLENISRVALTTNGLTLKRDIPKLDSAGLRTINISLDSLKRDKYLKITKKDKLADVLSGIEMALQSNIKRVKLNMVVIQGLNDDELLDFAKLTYDYPLQVRFIEYMPVRGSNWDKKLLLSMDKVQDQISQLGELHPRSKAQWGGPAKIFQLENAKGDLGFISAVSSHYCGDCNRLRITSEGKLLTCLFGVPDLDLKLLLRTGKDESEIVAKIREVLANKNAIRTLPKSAKEPTNQTGMSIIGG
ncbi:MAG: GTP 3',8-cyclase MoaA [Nitrospinota bacterium]